MFLVIVKWLARLVLLAAMIATLLLLVGGIITVVKELHDEWKDWRKKR